MTNKQVEKILFWLNKHNYKYNKSTYFLEIDI